MFNKWVESNKLIIISGILLSLVYILLRMNNMLQIKDCYMDFKLFIDIFATITCLSIPGMIRELLKI